MKTADPTVTIIGNTWFIHEWLALGAIFNLGHGRDVSADIDEDKLIGEWWNLKGAVEAGELETARRDREAPGDLER